LTALNLSAIVSTAKAGYESLRQSIFRARVMDNLPPHWRSILMRNHLVFLRIAVAFLILAAARAGAVENAQWRGIHFMCPGKEGLPYLKRAVAETLAPIGVNVIVLEMNTWYNYKSHPELRACVKSPHLVGLASGARR